MPLVRPQAVTVLRPGAVTYVAGLPVYAPGTELTITASVQPLDAWRVERAPEGLRARDWILVVSRQPVLTARGAEGQTPDLVVYQGRRYQVHQVDDWGSGLIPHHAATCYAAEGSEGAAYVEAT